MGGEAEGIGHLSHCSPASPSQSISVPHPVEARDTDPPRAQASTVPGCHPTHRSGTPLPLLSPADLTHRSEQPTVFSNTTPGSRHQCTSSGGGCTGIRPRCRRSQQVQRGKQLTLGLPAQLQSWMYTSSVTLQSSACLGVWQGQVCRSHSPRKLPPRQWLHHSPDGFCQPRTPSGPAACLGHWISGDTQSEPPLGSGGGEARGPTLRQEALFFNIPCHLPVADPGTKNGS